MKILELTEYTPKTVPATEFPVALGEMLRHDYAAQIHIEPPSVFNATQWTLTPQGWVGYIPLNADLSLHLRPRVPLDTLFGMLEVAYRLRSFRFLDGAMPCTSLAEFYERWAHILAQRVLDRARRGLYRGYVAREEALPYVTGRLDVQALARKPWDTHVHCVYETHTADVADNQILAWTLRHILHSGLCTERTLPMIRQAYRVLRGAITPTPSTAQECVGRLYQRLNFDYQPLHALCRFILEHSGPSHQMGARTVLPFLVNMPRLYELFVAEWLRQHLPPEMRLESQERVTFGTEQRAGRGRRLRHQVQNPGSPCLR